MATVENTPRNTKANHQPGVNNERSAKKLIGYDSLTESQKAVADEQLQTKLREHLNSGTHPQSAWRKAAHDVKRSLEAIGAPTEYADKVRKNLEERGIAEPPAKTPEATADPQKYSASVRQALESNGVTSAPPVPEFEREAAAKETLAEIFQHFEETPETAREAAEYAAEQNDLGSMSDEEVKEYGGHIIEARNELPEGIEDRLIGAIQATDWRRDMEPGHDEELARTLDIKQGQAISRYVDMLKAEEGAAMDGGTPTATEARATAKRNVREELEGLGISPQNIANVEASIPPEKATPYVGVGGRTKADTVAFREGLLAQKEHLSRPAPGEQTAFPKTEDDIQRRAELELRYARPRAELAAEDRAVAIGLDPDRYAIRYEEGAKREIAGWSEEQRTRLGMIADLNDYRAEVRGEKTPQLDGANAHNVLKASTYRSAEDMMAARFVEQLRTGNRHIDLSVTYATGDQTKATERHEAAIQNLQPMIDQARENGYTVSEGEALMTRIEVKEVLAVDHRNERGEDHRISL